MAAPKFEKRQKVRFDVEGLHGGVRLPADARIIDLSTSGLGVETDPWLQVGRGSTVTLPTGSTSLRVSGTVAWCRLSRTARNEAGESAPVYKAGIELRERDAATVEAIEGLLSRSARVGTACRRRPHAPEPAGSGAAHRLVAFAGPRERSVSTSPGSRFRPVSERPRYP